MGQCTYILGIYSRYPYVMTINTNPWIPVFVAAISGSVVTYLVLSISRDRKKTSISDKSIRPFDQSLSQSPTSILIRPPFPPILQEMLSKCRLAYLSTVDMITIETTAMLSSHLSLMRFTYIKDDECEGDGIIILSTNRKTKKYDLLLRHKYVALLIHDFNQFNEEKNASNVPNEESDDTRRMIASTCSITLNGECHILADDDPKCTRYREAHLKNNPDYPQFIVADDIAILYISVTSARICNVMDQVVKWSVFDNSLCYT